MDAAPTAHPRVAAGGYLRAATVAHVLPGRLRVRIDDLKGHPGLCSSIERELRGLGGVCRVETNPVIGSLLVAYDEAVLDRCDVLAALLRWDVVVDATFGPPEVLGKASGKGSEKGSDISGARPALSAPTSGRARRVVGTVVRSGFEAAIQSAVQSAVRRLLV